MPQHGLQYCSQNRSLKKAIALTCAHYMQHLLSRCDRIVKTANIFLTDNEMHRMKPKLSLSSVVSTLS